MKHVFRAGMKVSKCSDTRCSLLNMENNRKSEISWSGTSWTCGKQLQHYQAFSRNGTTIVAHSFVLVTSEEETRYLAYLEDMYEDKRGEKKVKVISAECVDDIATVLTPEHYEKCLESFASSAGLCLGFRQYSKNKFKPFDLRTLRGYFNQAVLSCFGICNETGKGDEEIGYGSTKEHFGPRRTRFVKVRNKLFEEHLSTKISGLSGHITTCRSTYHNTGFNFIFQRQLPVNFVESHNLVSPPFKVGEKIELLCQDSGIRGCWFRCTVLELSHKKLKVRYLDVQNVDGYGNLEEWVSASRTAAPDRLGMRYSGRLTVCLKQVLAISATLLTYLKQALAFSTILILTKLNVLDFDNKLYLLEFPTGSLTKLNVLDFDNKPRAVVDCGLV
ncbi:hypothetical protein ZIOFF_068045 [Zingiber officinale]|uniref:Agenet-like domain-containing protein n=1 Tax=Zingiber officinale TaxID=94328 RepID=A0A8J5EVK0_ZINOF|nr:hypothetical protein ZIOFF_068045 [Zingiber officinale]